MLVGTLPPHFIVHKCCFYCVHSLYSRPEVQGCCCLASLTNPVVCIISFQYSCCFLSNIRMFDLIFIDYILWIMLLNNMHPSTKPDIILYDYISPCAIHASWATSGGGSVCGLSRKTLQSCSAPDWRTSGLRETTVLSKSSLKDNKHCKHPVSLFPQVHWTLFHYHTAVFLLPGLFWSGSLLPGPHWHCCWQTANAGWSWNLVVCWLDPAHHWWAYAQRLQQLVHLLLRGKDKLQLRTLPPSQLFVCQILLDRYFRDLPIAWHGYAHSLCGLFWGSGWGSFTAVLCKVESRDLLRDPTGFLWAPEKNVE